MPMRFDDALRARGFRRHGRHRGRAAFSLAAILIAAAGLQGCVALTLGGAGAAAGAAAQERTVGEAVDDLTIQTRLEAKLLDAAPDLFADVGTEVVQGRVLLTGKVPTRMDRVRAVRIAYDVPQVREVIDEIEIGEGDGFGGWADDRLIATRLNWRLLNDDDVKSINYHVEVVDGTVYLMGNARSPAERARAIDHARSVPGVKRVVDHMN